MIGFFPDQIFHWLSEKTQRHWGNSDILQERPRHGFVEFLQPKNTLGPRSDQIIISLNLPD